MQPTPAEYEDGLVRVRDFDGRLRAVRREAEALAKAVEPYAVEADELSVLHTGVVDALRDSGLAALVVPAAYGGR